MKKIMKKLVPFALVLALLVSCSAFGMAETADGAEEAAKLLEDIKGTYEPLFPVITKPEYDEIWLDPRYQEAVEEARTITMFPGTSEHQLGLAVDLMDKPYSKMVYENMNQEFFKYLDSICAKYGFIKRYPTRKLLLTGWDEPWHYRYVGVEAATFIMEQGLCYEEFYAHYVPDFEY